MKRYTDELLEQLRARAVVQDYYGMDLIVKRLPDSDEEGAMDPRLYEDSKKSLKMMAWMPKGLMKMDTSEKGILKLREMFNGIKSIPCTSPEISIEEVIVPADDGYGIPLRIYRHPETVADAPILFYIHGGGFFGGYMGVVEESVKMFVEKSHFLAVSIAYRLAPEHRYPRGHQDCYQGFQWVYEHARQMGGNPDLIFVAGDSAGGNLAQYCTTHDWQDGHHHVKGQLLLYPTLNMAKVEDEFYHPSLDQFAMTPKQKRGLSRMIGMFGSMTDSLEPLLGVQDVKQDDLNPYTRDPQLNPATFVAVGEHDFLKLETLGYAAKLHRAGVDVTAVLYHGFGHAFFDNTGVYPQCEDCIEEMIRFIEKHC